MRWTLDDEASNAIYTRPYAQDLEQMSQDWSKSFVSMTRRGGDPTKTKNRAFPASSSSGAELGSGGGGGGDGGGDIDSLNEHTVKGGGRGDEDDAGAGGEGGEAGARCGNLPRRRDVPARVKAPSRESVELGGGSFARSAGTNLSAIAGKVAEAAAAGAYPRPFLCSTRVVLVTEMN